MAYDGLQWFTNGLPMVLQSPCQRLQWFTMAYDGLPSGLSMVCKTYTPRIFTSIPIHIYHLP